MKPTRFLFAAIVTSVVASSATAQMRIIPHLTRAGGDFTTASGETESFGLEQMIEQTYDITQNTTGEPTVTADALTLVHDEFMGGLSLTMDFQSFDFSTFVATQHNRRVEIRVVFNLEIDGQSADATPEGVLVSEYVAPDAADFNPPVGTSFLLASPVVFEFSSAAGDEIRTLTLDTTTGLRVVPAPAPAVALGFAGVLLGRRRDRS